MALRVNSKTMTGANVGRPSVRCSAVPLGHVHFTPPVIAPVRAPATEVVSIMTKGNANKPFEVLQAPSDLLMNTDSMYLLAADDDPDRRQQDAQDVIGDFLAWVKSKADNQLDKQKSVDDSIADLQQK